MTIRPNPATAPTNPPRKTLEDRRIATTRLSAGFGAAVSGFYLFRNLRQHEFDVFRLDYPAGAIEFVALSIFIFAALMARRYRLPMSWLTMATVCTISTLMTALYGRDAGSHLFLLMVGPTTAIVVEAKRPYPVLFSCFVASVLYTLLEFLILERMDPHLHFLLQVKDPATVLASLREADIYHIINIFAAEFGISLCTYMAMHWATISETALMREFARSELLLHNLLPTTIANRLKDDPAEIIADRFESITILFADVVNFTQASTDKRPEDVINFLSRLFGEFDALAEAHGLEKIKTIGDCYMVAGGLPTRSEHHTQSMADMALDMIAVSERLMAAFDQNLSIRIGIHAGPAMAGVIGHNKPYYDVWGDTINVGSRMESSSLPGRIQVTTEVKDMLGDQYDFESRGSIDIKGKGAMDLYFLIGKAIGSQRTTEPVAG